MARSFRSPVLELLNRSLLSIPLGLRKDAFSVTDVHSSSCLEEDVRLQLDHIVIPRVLDFSQSLNPKLGVLASPIRGVAASALHIG